MKTSPPFYNILHNSLKLCFSLALLIAGSYSAYAQCPTACPGMQSFAAGSTVYVDIDSSKQCETAIEK
jgi:hypothetical protein